LRCLRSGHGNTTAVPEGPLLVDDRAIFHQCPGGPREVIIWIDLKELIDHRERFGVFSLCGQPRASRTRLEIRSDGTAPVTFVVGCAACAGQFVRILQDIAIRRFRAIFFKSSQWRSWITPPSTTKPIFPRPRHILEDQVKRLPNFTLLRRAVTGALRSISAASRARQFTKMFAPLTSRKKVDHVGEADTVNFTSGRTLSSSARATALRGSSTGCARHRCGGRHRRRRSGLRTRCDLRFVMKHPTTPAAAVPQPRQILALPRRDRLDPLAKQFVIRANAAIGTAPGRRFNVVAIASIVSPYCREFDSIQPFQHRLIADQFPHRTKSVDAPTTRRG